MIKRILVALSGTPYTKSAVRHAIELARRHEAELTGVTIANLAAMTNVGPIPLGAGAAAAELVHFRQAITEERVEKAIEEFEDACRRTDTPHAVAREAGDPFEELISLCRYHDLTILGLKGLFEYGVVHNPDDYLISLIRQHVRPILAVAESHREIKRVLIAYDGSMPAAKAMKQFAQARLFDDLTVKIVCFHKKPEDAEKLLADADTYCRAHGLDVSAEYQEGTTRETLLPHAEEWNADLVVLGSSTKSRMRRYVLGDTCLHTIRHAHMPLYLSR